MTEAELDAVARSVARWLTPYIAEELASDGKRGRADATFSYDDSSCASFVSALGDVVLNNAGVFFTALAKNGQIGSLALAAAIGVPSPRSIPAVLTTPLKRRSKALSLPNPWLEDVHDDRTLWLDRDGISSRMLVAISAEKSQRAVRSAA